MPETGNSLKMQGILTSFFLREWLLVVSGTGLVLTSLFAKIFPSYSVQEVEVLFILMVLFLAVNGLQNSGLILKIAQSVEKGKAIPLKLVLATFFLSMLVTNDVALIVIVPLTLSLRINRKDVLVILEALAANSGSALTPVGNPQNLYIYWFYGLHPGTFISAIAPFSLLFLIVLVVASFFVTSGKEVREGRVRSVDKKAYFYGILLFIVLLTVFHILPVIAGGTGILFALIFDRKALRIDYSLLVTFLFFFGIADNLKIMLASEINHSGHIFIFTALASQFMSNVPATLLFAKFTSNWQALLWGANAGGFGSLFGSLANLIAYKMYIACEGPDNTTGFIVKFLLMGYMALCVSTGLYFILYQAARF